MAEYAFLGWKGGGQTLCGEHKIVLTQHTGPTSYTQITAGTPPAAPTGGDSVSAVACGLNLIEAVIPLGDSSGTYTAVPFQPAVSTTGVLAGQGAAVKTVPLEWITAATGAQVSGTTNLSAVQLNLVVIGY